MIGFIKTLSKIPVSENIFPPRELILKVLLLPNEPKVVIIGQDPYHGRNQANGLAFAVNKDCRIPPSLKNIMKVSNCSDRTLLSWSNQGVLLLNTVLTVEEKKPNSHVKIGWEINTKNFIRHINYTYSNVVFMLWGKSAQSNFIKLIDQNRHLILKSTHPSGFSCLKTGTSCGDPFMKCSHFKKANEYLERNGKAPIQWDLNN